MLKEFEEFVLSPVTSEKSKKLSTLMEVNLELCHRFVTHFLKEKNQACCERLIMDSELSLYALDIGSFTVLQNGVSSDCLLQYIRKYIKVFCEKSSMDVVLQRDVQ